MSHDQSHGQPAHRSDQGPPPNGHGQPPNGWHEFEPDTSERLYTSEEFAAYSDARLRQAEQPLPQAPQGDPLTDPMPGDAHPGAPVVRRRTRLRPSRAASGAAALDRARRAREAAPQETYRPPAPRRP